MATDPVCGMYVDERSAELRLARDNRTYYFCCSACLAEFADPEAADRRWNRDLALAAAIAVAVVGLQDGLPGRVGDTVAAALTAIALAGPGRVFFRGLRDAVRSRVANMDVLIAIGTTSAFAYGVVVLAVPGALPSALFFDAATLILALLFAGNYLERRTRRRAGSALRSLAALLPPTAHRYRDGAEADVPIGELAVGDRVVVRAGERVPADGRILGGRSELDEATITGEPLPRARGPGEPVFAGARNGDGRLEVEVRRVGPESFVGQIGSLLREAEGAKVRIQARADAIAAVFVPAVLGLAVAASVAWALVGGAALPFAVLIFVTVTISACPCAFGLATPAALLAGTATAAERGILYRGGDALEATAQVGTVFFDKTGTLTDGRPTLAHVHFAPGGVADPILAAAVAVESVSDHPFARALREAAAERGLRVPSADEARVRPGVGVEGRVGGHRYRVGRRTSGDTLPPELWNASETAGPAGSTVVVVWQDDAAVALLEFVDRVRPEARAALDRLRARGCRIEILSGDGTEAVARTAARLGVEAFAAERTPAEKAEAVRSARREGRTVAFVGDGINDAPALATADVGIALGTGTEVARQAGSVLLVGSDLRGVPDAIELADRTVRKVDQNLAWAIGYNAILLPIAAGALVPLLGFRVYDLLPELGALAMGLSSTIVLTNSLTLRAAAAPAGSGPVPSIGEPRPDAGEQ